MSPEEEPTPPPPLSTPSSAPTPTPVSMPQSTSSPRSRVSKLPWILVFLLVIAIGAIIIIWKPWQPNIKASDRTISVTGDATITATPDQYTFSPSYSVTNGDKQAALNATAAKSTQIVTGLKGLGVANSDIKTDTSGYGSANYLPVQTKNGFTYTLGLTVTINDAKLAQKVQDYLVSTGPTGDVSPEVDFSDAMQRSLQDKARTQAEKDARSKANQSAGNLGFKVDAVKSVADGNFDNGLRGPIFNGAISDSANGAAAPQLTVQPGQNQLDYSVTVIYYIH